MFQILLTPSAGKRLIAKATIELPLVKAALRNGTIVVIAGSTNGYVAEELLTSIGQEQEFMRNRFVRGLVLPPVVRPSDAGKLPDASQFPGDVVIVHGSWQKGRTILDAVDELKEGDVIIKGANCVNLVQKKAGILIGHPKGGTYGAALQAVVGRRVKLILPVGLEKRVVDDIDAIASLLNRPGSTGLRMLPAAGDIVTEIEAIETLSGAKAMLVAAGGVFGAEGAVWLAIEGDEEQVRKARASLEAIAKEVPFGM